MDEIEQFLTENAVKINEFRAKYGDLAVVKSGWGPICLFRKPGFMDSLKFNAESTYSESKLEKAWAPIKFVEQLILIPSAQEFTALREKHGYDFADNLCAEVQIQFRPEVKTSAKKI